MKLQELVSGEQHTPVAVSQTFAGIASLSTALSALSFLFGETPLQISAFFILALISMTFACAGFPYRTNKPPQTTSVKNRDDELESLARSVGALVSTP